ncbi:MAG TPA: enoyl-CoA hydratase/isomerase family protein [Isosphaeraceae bacterium]
MSQPFVRTEARGPVALITVDRPDRSNALSSPVIAGLGDALDGARYDPAIRSIVLTGAGSVFCSGMDLQEAVQTLASGAPEAEHAAVATAQALADLFVQIHDCPKPVIAAVNGDALAGGAGLAMACDLVVAADSARIGYPEVKRGLVAAIVMHDLTRLLGDRRARQLLLTGDPIAASDAERWGLVNRVVPAAECLEAAMALGRSLLESGPIALEATKKQLDEVTRRPRDLRGSAAVSAAIRVSDEASEGMASFLEKRRPRWASHPG